MKQQLQQTTELFLQNLGAKVEAITVTEVQENIFNVHISSPDSGLLIWGSGKNLTAISHLLNLFFAQKTDNYIRVHVEVNDYIEQKNEKLKSRILSKIRYVEKTGNDVKLPFYSAYERKKIHSIVSEYENKQIYTKSIGEGKERRLHICKKEDALSIDIDGIEI